MTDQNDRDPRATDVISRAQRITEQVERIETLFHQRYPVRGFVPARGDLHLSWRRFGNAEDARFRLVASNPRGGHPPIAIGDLPMLDRFEALAEVPELARVLEAELRKIEDTGVATEEALHLFLERETR